MGSNTPQKLKRFAFRFVSLALYPPLNKLNGLDHSKTSKRSTLLFFSLALPVPYAALKEGPTGKRHYWGTRDQPNR